MCEKEQITYKFQSVLVKLFHLIYHFSYGNYDQKNQFGYGYADEYSHDELLEKQGGPTPADFIPFVASLSLPLTAALVTFVAIVSVSAAFLLFPETIEIDVNSRHGVLKI